VLLPVRLVRLPFDVLFLTVDFLRVTVWGLNNLPNWLSGVPFTPFRARYMGGLLSKTEREPVCFCSLAAKYGTKAWLRLLFPTLVQHRREDGRRYLAWAGHSNLPVTSLSRWFLTGLVLALCWGVPSAALAWRTRHAIMALWRGEPQPSPDRDRTRMPFERDPELAARHVARGLELERAGKGADAREAFREGAGKDDRNVNALLGWGRTSLEMGFVDDARAAFAQALELDGKHRQANLGMARVLHKQGADAAAIETLEKVLADSPRDSEGLPNDAEALALKAGCLQDLGNREQAAEVVAQALEQSPKDPTVLTTAGEIEASRGNLTKAEMHYRAVVDVDADSSAGRVGLARILRLKQDLRQAEEVLLALLAEKPDDPLAVDELIAVQIAAGRRMEALTRCRDTVSRHPEMVPLREKLCGLLLAFNWDNELHDVATKLLDDYPGNVTAHLHLAAMFLRKNLPSLAIPHCDTANAQRPGLRAAVRMHVAALMMRGEFDRAVAKLQPIVAKYPRDLEFMIQLSECYKWQGKTAEGLQVLQAAVKLQPRSPIARSQLAQFFYLNQQPQEALAEFRAAREILPDDAMTLNNLAAAITYTGGDLDEAPKYSTRARELDPRNPQIVDTLGWIYFSRKEYSQALPFTDMATALGPDQPILLHHHAEVLAALGHGAEAREYVRRALGVGVRFQDMDKAVALLRRLEEGSTVPMP
jgi:tetratricopeptide (TPR) repeat protein